MSDLDVLGGNKLATSNELSASLADSIPLLDLAEEPSDDLFPSEDDRPAYVVLPEWGEAKGKKYRPGTYYCTIDVLEGVKILKNEWFCSPLFIDAVTYDGQENNFGRLLRFKNTLGRWRTWAMPMALLKGAGDELRGELLQMGVELHHRHARTHLPSYLQRERPQKRMNCALQVGWCNDAFVLPDKSIGPHADGVIFQTGEVAPDEFATAGTLEEWRQGVAAPAIGNPILTLAISAAFAGPLLKSCGGESGGIHFLGDSSSGKSTCIFAACSVWGGSGYLRSWRATANGLEGAAVLFNDGLLALDEINECDPREVGAIAYSLGNGRGKQRASRSGSARAVSRWRVFVLSSGERSIETILSEAGQRIKAGQAVRLLDIPATRTYGAWDTLHEHQSGADLADSVKKATIRHYGHVGRGFLERLTHDGRNLSAILEEVKTLPGFKAEDGQERRVAARLALVGLAGELATEYGLTGWPEGEAIKTAQEGFRLWLNRRGKGNDELRQVLTQVSDFIDRHGDARFSDAGFVGETPTVRDRAGWWSDDPEQGGRTYLFTSGGMREALKGFDFGRGLDLLTEAGALPAPKSNGEHSRSKRIGTEVKKLYPILAKNLSEGKDGA